MELITATSIFCQFFLSRLVHASLRHRIGTPLKLCAGMTILRNALFFTSTSPLPPDPMPI